MNFRKTTFEVSIDDNENIIDTISIVKTKTDDNEKTLYTLKEYLPKVDGQPIQHSYFRNDEDLFYQETKINEEYKSIFQTFVNKDNVIVNAQMISIASESPNDTISMNYDYKYDSDGKKESLFITSKTDSINSLNYTEYNKNGESILGYLIFDNDTLQKRKMKYLNGKMIESTYESKEPFRITISTFDSNEKIKSEILYLKINDTIKKASESTYDNSKYDNTELIITKDFLYDTITKKKKITAHLSRI
ncbi:hypothetical protein FPF71_12635 [Algibacter amylolyticus]|uniref:DUF4595 domain-containing protein n=1 Tax=Algibacter amylolyticus TaxID=1608400 RepID=A0A5M7B840_9FLAO|nr:hypothetical protein [Algibacter amylolyticus]KAA5823545.1 hypothetical protein F2B50_12635 [Algibacter amylolyticus]MBB5267699.1 hypothetical protein [Algibacter amylolyticus]TSJ74033.1 hypothetical protein FPF71_12635 [Algibacter amylolyticus]